MTYAKAFGVTSLGMLLMSFESPLIKMTTIPAQSVTFYFGLFMFAITHIVLGIQQKSAFFEVYRVHYKPILLSAFFMGISNLFFILAVKHTSVASAVFILSTAPLVSALIAFIFFRQKTPRRTFGAIFFVFVGLSIILFNDLGLGNMLGNFYAFLCVLSFTSLFSVLERYKEVSRLACVGAGGLVASLLALMTASIVLPDPYSFKIILFMGALLTPISRVCIGIGTKFLPSVEVALLTIIEPVLAPFWVWMMMDEKPHSNTLIGGAIIVTTLLVHSMMAHKEAKKRNN
jgi:drug/metabolite transporter (DMT)-like permease